MGLNGNNTHTFPRLFKINANGKKMRWDVKVQRDCNSRNYLVISTHGEVGGKLQTTTVNIEKGKASRSIQEQAYSEAQSKWNEKKKTYEEEGQVAKPASSSSSLSNGFNGGEGKNVKIRSMLASPFNIDLYSNSSTSRAFKLKISSGVGAQRKFDGICCMIHQDADLKKRGRNGERECGGEYSD